MLGTINNNFIPREVQPPSLMGEQSFLLFLCLILILFFSERRKCVLDLGLMIDQTGSMQNKDLPVIREAVKHFVTNFIIGTCVHVSLASFANVATLQQVQ